MTRIIQALMTWARAHRRLVFALTLLLAVGSAWPVSRIRFETDVLQLMPRDTGAVDAFETYLERFGSLDALYVAIEAPGDESISSYADYIDELADALRELPEVTRVDTGLIRTVPGDARSSEPTPDWGWLGDRQLLLLDDETFAKAAATMDRDAIQARVRDTKGLLDLASPDIKALVQRDPLGWFELTRAGLDKASSLLGLDPTRSNGYISPDGGAQLLLVHAARPPFDTDFAHQLVDRVRNVEADLRSRWASEWAEEGLEPPRVDLAGGHRTAVETEALMHEEAVSNTVWSLVGVLGLLFLAFRNWWLVIFGAIPMLLGTLVTLAVFQLSGVQLTAAATGASAMLFGLGDDGLLLLFVAYRQKLAQGLTPMEAVRSMGGTGVSVMLGELTTAATFLALFCLSFPSLRQLGGVIGVGMLFTAFFTLTVLVAGLPGASWLGQSRDLSMPALARIVSRHRRAIVVAAVLVTLPLAWGLTRLRVDSAIERLRPVTEGLAIETHLTERFDLPRDTYLVIARGPELEPLLRSHESLTQAVRHENGIAHVGPGAILPSAQTQAARREALTRLRVSASDVANAVDAAAEAEGFLPGTFAPFRDRLPRLLDASQAISLDALTSHGFGDLIGRFVRRDGDDYVVAAYASATDAQAAATLEARVASTPGLVLTGLPIVNAALAERFPRELGLGLLVGTVVVLLLIWMEFRRLGPTLLAMIPTLCGLVWGLGILGWAGETLDVFSVFAILMFLGIGVDYGIHLLHPTLGSSDGHDAVDVSSALALVGPAILLAGATTIAGFGTLVTSNYGPLRSLGLTSVATIAASLLAALLLLPALVTSSSTTPETRA